MAVEADWPDAYRVNRYVTGASSDMTTREALGDFRRFPTWMWRNTEVCDFIAWRHIHNQTLEPHQRIGFYGLDLYSLHASIEAVVRYLDLVDPPAAARARQRYSCFDHSAREGQIYGAEARLRIEAPCESAVVAELVELRHASAAYLARSGWVGRDELFFARQNASVVAAAEEYYRETHLADQFDAIVHIDHTTALEPLERTSVWEKGEPPDTYPNGI